MATRWELAEKFRVLVAGDDVAGAQRLDLVDREAPFVETCERRLAEVQVGAVVDDVTGHDESEIGNIEPMPRGC